LLEHRHRLNQLLDAAAVGQMDADADHRDHQRREDRLRDDDRRRDRRDCEERKQRKDRQRARTLRQLGAEEAVDVVEVELRDLRELARGGCAALANARDLALAPLERRAVEPRRAHEVIEELLPRAAAGGVDARGHGVEIEIAPGPLVDDVRLGVDRTLGAVRSDARDVTLGDHARLGTAG
jgi:hypothetical protein